MRNGISTESRTYATDLCVNKGRPAAYKAFSIGVGQLSLGVWVPNDRGWENYPSSGRS
jgi:hypothetical protein